MTTAARPGRFSGLDRKLVQGVLILFLIPTVLAGVVLGVLYAQGVFEDSPRAVGLAAAIGFVTMVGYLAVAAHGLGRGLLRTLHEIQLGTELMASVNPGHRLAVHTGDELEFLAREINRLADHALDARTGLEREVARATHALRTEQARLSAVVAALGEGVAVATPEGQVALANDAARRLLGVDGALLGQSLWDVVDHEQVGPFLDRLCDRPGGVERFSLSLASGVVLAAVVTALRDDDRLSGFALVLRDVSESAPVEAEPPEVTRPVRRSGFEGAGMASGAAASAAPDERPDLHDLSLLDQMERALQPAERERGLDALSYVVLDVETTGLAPEGGDRIVSLAGVRVRDGAVRRGEVFDALVNPGRPIPAASVRFHGITDAMVSGAPPIEVVLPAFLRFAGDGVLVGHQVSFDLAFLARAATRAGLVPPGRTHAVLDTLLLSAAVHGRLEEHGLEAVAGRLGVTVRGRHSALGDALTTAEVLVKLLALARRRGIVTLGQALAESRRVRGAAPS